MNQEIISKGQAVLKRFIKGGLAGALAAIGAITIASPHTWSDVSSAVAVLVYSVIVGFFSGGIMAIEKAYNWTDPEIKTTTTE